MVYDSDYMSGMGDYLTEMEIEREGIAKNLRRLTLDQLIRKADEFKKENIFIASVVKFYTATGGITNKQETALIRVLSCILMAE